MIRAATTDDAAAIVAIYNHYVLHTTISFETEAVSSAQMAQRIADVQAAGLPWLVLEQDGVLLGWAYATRWRVRHAYRFAVEVSVYLHPEAGGHGYGFALYQQLFAQLQALGIHCVIGGIALPNPASVALHEKMGMRQVAHFQEVGFKQDRWLDVGYWQRVF